MRRVEVVRVEPAVPMHADASKVLRRVGICVQRLRPRGDVVLVVVEADDLDLGVFLGEDRPEVVAHEARHVGWRVDAGLPPDRGLGLVLGREGGACVMPVACAIAAEVQRRGGACLHGDRPHVNAALLVRRDEPVTSSPGPDAIQMRSRCDQDARIGAPAEVLGPRALHLLGQPVRPRRDEHRSLTIDRLFHPCRRRPR